MTRLISAIILSLALLLLLGPAAWGTPLIQVDVNHSTTNPGDTQPGFTPLYVTDMEAGPGDNLSKVINDVLVNINGISSANERHRTTPVNNPPSLTQGALYRDFVFNSGAATINFAGLKPGAEYEVVVWAFDTGSVGNRMAEWAVTVGEGDAVSHSFDGLFPPTSDFDDTFMIVARADSLGQLQLTGTPAGTINPAVFINAFQLTEIPPIPEPSAVAIWLLLGVMAAGLCIQARRRSDK